MRLTRLLKIALFAGISSVTACSEELAPPEPDRPTIDSATFTRALSDIISARVELLPDTAAYERRAEEILRGYGVTAEDLRTFVQVHGQNDDLMMRAYAQVEARLDSLYPSGQEQPGAPDTLAATP
jgi:hypothetical protein